MSDKSEDIRQSDITDIHYKGYKFVITHRPTDLTIPSYILELKKHHVTTLVRVCEPTYQTDKLVNQNIQVVDLAFADGTSPSKEIFQEWFNILKMTNAGCCVAIHCVAGLGRAPVMVAIALIELGLDYEEAVELIRKKRRGAINAKQLDFLSKYRAKGRLKSRDAEKDGCYLQ